jgi:hypothetical protein
MKFIYFFIIQIFVTPLLFAQSAECDAIYKSAENIADKQGNYDAAIEVLKTAGQCKGETFAKLIASLEERKKDVLKTKKDKPVQSSSDSVVVMGETTTQNSSSKYESNPCKADYSNQAAIDIDSTKLEKGSLWYEAYSWFMKAYAFDYGGNAEKAIPIYEKSWEAALGAIRSDRDNKKPFTGNLQLLFSYVATYYGWNLLDKKEVRKTHSIVSDVSLYLPSTPSDDGTGSWYMARAAFDNMNSRCQGEFAILNHGSLEEHRRAMVSLDQAIRFAKQGIAIQKQNVKWKTSLMVYLYNMNYADDRVLTKTEKMKYREQAISLGIYEILPEETANRSFKIFIEKLYDYTFYIPKKNAADTIKKVITIFDGKIKKYESQAEKGFRYSSIYFWRAKLNARMSYYAATKADSREYMKKGLADWEKGIAMGEGCITCNNIDIMADAYFYLKSFANYFEDKEDKKTAIEFLGRINNVLDKFNQFYLGKDKKGKIPTVLLDMATDSYYQKAKLMKNNNYKPEDVLPLINEAIRLLENSPAIKIVNKQKFIKEFEPNKAQDNSKEIKFDEKFATYCSFYDLRLQVNAELKSLPKVKEDFENIKNIFGVVLTKFQYDFYLRQHFWSAYARYGKLLFDNGNYKEAKPLLEYASDWGNKESTQLLAKIYREGKIDKKIDTKKADKLDDIARGQSMKRFTVPCIMSSGEREPVSVYVSNYPPTFELKGIQDQAKWWLEARGVEVPNDVVEAFNKLYKIALENNVSFVDLCVYALGAAQQENETVDITGLKKQVASAASAQEKEQLHLKIISTLLEKYIKLDKLTTQQSSQLNNEITAYFVHLMANYADNKVIKQKVDDLMRVDKDKKTFLSDINNMANIINTKGWELLLAKEIDKSKKCIDVGLALNPENSYLKGNLCHILLFQGKFKEAKKMYEDLKDKPMIPADSRFPTFKDAFLDDFRIFEEKNIIPEKERKNVEKIKELLK